jgi:N-acetylmuramoyl-L-alanine amidase
LHGQHRPAVLIEAGFLSNPGDARQIENPAFRQKLAQAVADALRLKPEAGSQKTETGSQKPEAGTPVPGTNKLAWP